MQVNTTTVYLYTPIRMAKIKNKNTKALAIRSTGEIAEQLELPCWWECKTTQHLWNTFGNFLIKVKHTLNHMTLHPLPSIHPSFEYIWQIYL